jgi:hypothetical protein
MEVLVMKKIIVILSISIILLVSCEWEGEQKRFVSPVVEKPKVEVKALQCEYNWLTGMVCEYR